MAVSGSGVVGKALGVLAPSNRHTLGMRVMFLSNLVQAHEGVLALMISSTRLRSKARV